MASVNNSNNSILTIWKWCQYRIFRKYSNNYGMVGFAYTVQQTLISSSKNDKTWLYQCSSDPLIDLKSYPVGEIGNTQYNLQLYYSILLQSVRQHSNMRCMFPLWMKPWEVPSSVVRSVAIGVLEVSEWGFVSEHVILWPHLQPIRRAQYVARITLCSFYILSSLYWPSTLSVGWRERVGDEAWN